MLICNSCAPAVYTVARSNAARAGSRRLALFRIEVPHGETGDARVLPTLERVLLDPDAQVRRAAVQAIGDIGGDESASLLAFALRDPDPGLREDAVYALLDVGGGHAVLALQLALDDERPAVRSAAAEVLEELSTRP